MSNCYESDSFIFLIFGPFFVVFDFSFHFCFDLPQVSNCYADWGLITAAGEAYDSGWGADRERLMTADGGLITAAGEAYDSGREAHTRAGKAYDSGRRAFCVRFGFFSFYESDSFIF